MASIDLAWQRFGRLTVFERHGTSKHGKALWKCNCECGGSAIVTTQDLRNGHTQSCGCLQRENTSQALTKHGFRQTQIYHKWLDMKQRCFNPKNNRFSDWGGRGITVCDAWKDDFQTFYNYVSQLPHYGEEGYTLDRINNDGNYEPGNVRWATAIEQANNKRNSKKENKNGTKNEPVPIA